ncbi:M20/M25/M40 family metallo-hydrolase [Paraflavitalea speifideaquila]|uniref:M20/M25/M40 family metallo-hydrolase n=1 Tax=Paraflavitalea speifideaquila TaxID=3076558 RepID=UPI0028E899A0|nr:M20/M25/M40 family metallo-hydrolase [Paraflavitalea speifideiaquila]
MRNMLLILLSLILVLVITVVIKTAIYPFTKTPTAAEAFRAPVDESAVRRLSGGIKIPTISTGESGVFNYAPFDSLKTYLQANYPLVYKNCVYEEVNNYGLVFRWKGKDSSKQPILFLSHQDVVPPGTAPVKDSSTNIFNLDAKSIPPIDTISEAWDYGPFSGAVINGRIYGRGSLDMKSMLFGLLEAMTKVMQEGFQPSRDIYLAFGFDEEVGGRMGAVNIASYFKNKGLHFDAVYDEGGIIATSGTISGMNNDVALIGCAEKGFLSARITVKGLGGHSSTPPLQSAIGKAAIIMQRLEQSQMKPEIIPLINNFFTNVGGSMSYTNKMAIANQWLLRSILSKQLTKIIRQMH